MCDSAFSLCQHQVTRPIERWLPSEPEGTSPILGGSSEYKSGHTDQSLASLCFQYSPLNCQARPCSWGCSECSRGREQQGGQRRQESLPDLPVF